MDAIDLEIVAAVPRSLLAGDAQYITVDVRHDATAWPYDREEHPLYCVTGASTGLDLTPVGAESMILHRFGGTYGGVTYKLTADGTAPDGHLVVKLLNAAGITLGAARIGDIAIHRPAPAPATSGFRFTGRAAALVIAVTDYVDARGLDTVSPAAIDAAQAFADWAVQRGGVAPEDLYVHWKRDRVTGAAIRIHVEDLLKRGRFDRVYLYFSGIGQARPDDAFLLPVDTRRPIGRNVIMLSWLQRELQSTAPELFSFLWLDERPFQDLWPGPQHPEWVLQDPRPPRARFHTMQAKSHPAAFAGALLEALAGEAAREGAVRWLDVADHVSGRLSATVAHSMAFNPVLVSDGSAVESPRVELPAPLRDVPAFTGHYVYLASADGVPTPEAASAARDLGLGLAAAGLGLITNRRGGVDQICADAYGAAIGDSAQTRIVEIAESPPGEVEVRSWMLANDRAHRHKISCRLAMAMVLIGGDDDSRDALTEARLQQRQDFPIGGTGGYVDVVTQGIESLQPPPDPAQFVAAALASLGDMVTTGNWPNPSLARSFAYQDLASALVRVGLIDAFGGLDVDDESTPLVQVFGKPLPELAPNAVEDWAKEKHDTVELALAIELLIELGAPHSVHEIASERTPEQWNRAADIARRYLGKDHDLSLLSSPWVADEIRTPLVPGLTFIGRQQLLAHLRTMTSGDKRALLVDGPPDSGKSYTVRILGSYLDRLGPPHRLIVVRAGETSFDDMIAELGTELGRTPPPPDDTGFTPRWLGRLAAWILQGDPETTLWLAFDLDGQRDDLPLLNLMQVLIVQAVDRRDPRLVIIDSGLTPRPDQVSDLLQEQVARPSWHDIEAFVLARYPDTGHQRTELIDQLAQAASQGWSHLAVRLRSLPQINPVVPPLVIEGKTIIGRQQTWENLWELAWGTHRVLLIRGPRASGKTFTFGLVNEVVKRLGPAHHLVALRLLDGTFEQFALQAEVALGRPHLPDTAEPPFARFQAVLAGALQASPGVTIWFALDVGGHEPDHQLSNAFLNLAELSAFKGRARLILIDTDFELSGPFDGKVLRERLAYPSRDEIERFLAQHHPGTDQVEEVVATAQLGWSTLLPALELVDERSKTPPVPRLAGLAKLAREYDELRKQPPSMDRTKAMDEVVARASDPAVHGEPDAGDVQALFSHDGATAGERIVALGCCAWLGADAPFGIFSEALGKPANPHEHRMALHILRGIIEDGVWWQAESVIEVVLQQAADPASLVNTTRAEIRDEVVPAILAGYRANCGLPSSSTPAMLAEWWLPAGKPWTGLARTMVLFGSAPAGPITGFAAALGTELARGGWEVVAGNGPGVGEVAVLAARQAGGEATVLFVGDEWHPVGADQVDENADDRDFTSGRGVHASLLARGECAIAIAGGTGTDQECRDAIARGIPLLLTSTRDRWPHGDAAREHLIAYGLPGEIVAALEHRPAEPAEHARIVVRVANCVRWRSIPKRLDRRQRRQLHQFLETRLDKEQLTALADEITHFTGGMSRAAALIDYCSKHFMIDTLIEKVIARTPDSAALSALLRSINYRRR